jgi:hypothetical protein
MRAQERNSRVKIHILDPKAANYARLHDSEAYFVLITLRSGVSLSTFWQI